MLAHELGHLKHRDNTRSLIYNGGTSFLIGLLFGDVTGSGALIFASRSLVTASYSREAEQNADTFSIDVMHRLGRSPKPMGELLFRVTGKEGDKSLSILANHPLTEDRLQRMSDEDRRRSGPPLLTRGGMGRAEGDLRIRVGCRPSLHSEGDDGAARRSLRQIVDLLHPGPHIGEHRPAAPP